MSTPSTARKPLPNRFVSPWVSTIVSSVDIMPTSFCAKSPKIGLQVGRMEPGQGRAPRCARWRREPLPDSGQGTGVHCDRSAVKGGDGRGPEAFDDQINA